MSIFATVVSVLAPVNTSVLERFPDLMVLGDRDFGEIDDAGVSKEPVDNPANLMGAIYIVWHDSPEFDRSDVDEFVRGFSGSPTEMRVETIKDPALSEGEDWVSNRFQNEDGSSYEYGGFLLVRPETEDREQFFDLGKKTYLEL